MSEKPGEVFGLQIWEHLTGKESRRGDFFTSLLKLWEGREETVEGGCSDRGKFERTWTRSKWDPSTHHKPVGRSPLPWFSEEGSGLDPETERRECKWSWWRSWWASRTQPTSPFCTTNISANQGRGIMDWTVSVARRNSGLAHLKLHTLPPALPFPASLLSLCLKCNSPWPTWQIPTHCPNVILEVLSSRKPPLPPTRLDLKIFPQ